MGTCHIKSKMPVISADFWFSRNHDMILSQDHFFVKNTMHNSAPVIDSQKSVKEALAQNPDSLAPEDVLETLRVEVVEYVGFDGLIHQGQIVMHKDRLDDVLAFFELARKLSFPIRSVVPISDPRYVWDDERSCAGNNSSGFNYRTVSGNPTKLSRHALGVAFDINPVQNVYVRYDADLKEVFRFPPNCFYDKEASGTLTVDHPLVVFMKERGWVWGGDWTPESGRVDYQHFEKAL